MRKLLQAVVCGLAAASLGALAADNTTGIKTDKPVVKKAKKDQKQDKRSGAGGTQSSADTKTGAAPAPAPTPVEAPKKQ